MTADILSTPPAPQPDPPAGLLRALILALTRDEDDAVRQWAALLLKGDGRTEDVTC